MVSSSYNILIIILNVNIVLEISYNNLIITNV